MRNQVWPAVVSPLWLDCNHAQPSLCDITWHHVWADNSVSWQVVKLSDAVQTLPRQTTQFIHGVPQQFLAVGDKKSEPPAEGEERFTRGAYFMGKAVWAKGYTELLSLLESHRTAGNTEYAIDCYGNGEDLAAVMSCTHSQPEPSQVANTVLCVRVCVAGCGGTFSV